MQASGLGPDEYRVGIICALATEKMAVEGMLDEEYPGLPRQPGDDNDYTLGRIGEHRVIVACLPGGMTGTNSAAVVATNMMRSFPIRIGLMVGIAGGVWSKEKDIRLGDVIISQPDGMHGGVVQWDFGKMEADGFKRTGTLNKPPRELLNAVQGLRSSHGRKGDTLHVHLEKMLEDNPKMRDEGNFVYQGHENDVLYEATYRHENENVKTCAQCARSRIVTREERVDDRPRIHYGNIASGNEVVKDGPSRDRIAEKEGVIGFEMEAAGLMDSFPCLVIRGICDYADSHKNKRWQPYAAATAAAYAKELLLRIAPDDVIQMQTASKVTGRNL
jgi:nucleoside phosphorylase